MNKEDQYLFLSKKSAPNLLFRLISINDEPYFGYPEDTRRVDRVCVEIKNGKVVVVKFC